MKKTLAAALAATFVVGSVSTALAAPTDQEVAELRARIAELEKIVQQQNNRNGREVSNLESRVSDLEDSKSNSWSERFTIGGELRWSYWNLYKRPDVSNLQLRLLPTFKIDDHFTVKSRFRGTHNTQTDARAGVRMDWAYLEGKYDNFQFNIGKVPLFTNADRGLFADSDFSGLQVITGDKLKFAFNLGKWDNYAYAGAEVTTDNESGLNFGVGYHYAKEQDLKEKVSIINGGIGYRFNPDFELFGAVAHNTELNSDKTAYNIEANFKGADRKVKSSWGAYVAYRYAPGGVARATTYDTFAQDLSGINHNGKKGWEVGAAWVPYTNTLTELSYFNGKYFGSDADDRTLFARAKIFF